MNHMHFCGLIRTLASAVSVAWGVSGAFAVDLALDAPGSLAAAISGVPRDTRSLVISGKADAAELIVLRDSLPMLAALDMRGLAIMPPEIPEYAFAVTGLTEIRLPDDITVIGEGAFAAVPAVSVALPSALDSIGPYAFAHSKLVSVALPASLRAIGSNAFGDCVSLSRVDAGVGLVSLGESAFHGCALECLDLSGCKRLQSIGGRAFEGCESLVSVSLPVRDMALGQAVFMGCGKLHEVSGAAVKTIPPLMLADAPEADVSQVLTRGVTTIGGYAFSGNRSVSMVIPSTLDSIGDHGMERMKELISIDASDLEHVAALGYAVWDEVDQSAVSLTVADGMETLFSSADQWKEFKITHTSNIADIDVGATDVALRFDGSRLMVAALCEIVRVDAVTLDGILLAAVNPSAQEVSLDASRWPGDICIVAVTLAGGTRHVYTLSR